MSNEELMAFIKKHPVTVGCGVLSLALIGGIYFRSGFIPEAEAELGQKSTEAARHAANIKNAGQLKEQVDALVAANKEIDSRLIHASQLGLNNQYFYKLEADTGTKVVNFNRTQVAAPPKGSKNSFMPIGFSLSVQGTLAQLIDLLHRLEGGSKYCRVLTATCGANVGNRNGPLTMTLTLELLGLP